VEKTLHEKEDEKMTRRRLLTITGNIGIVLLLVFLPSLLLCAEKKPISKPQPNTLTIGCVAGMTGFSAGAERVFEQGSRVAEDWINEKGGIRIKGQQYLIKLVTEDHKSTSEGAAAAATKLVHGEKVKFMCGGIMPFTNISINSVTEQAGVLRAAIYNCGVPAEYGPQTPYTFITMNGTIEGVITAVTYLTEAHPEVKKIAGVSPDDGGVPHLTRRAMQITKERGISLQGDLIGFAMDTVDFTSIVKKAMASNPDAIAIVNAWPSMTGGILKTARQSGYTKPIFATNYQQNEDTLKVAGKEASTNFFQHCVTPGDPKNPPLMEELLRRAEVKYGHRLIYYISVGFDNLWMLAQAIEAAQSLEPAVVKDKWEKMDNMKSCYGPARLGGLKTYGINHTLSHPIPIGGLVNGEAKHLKWMNVLSP
jgi:branched-chain amino acid transport system substrate-binding protein